MSYDGMVRYHRTILKNQHTIYYKALSPAIGYESTRKNSYDTTVPNIITVQASKKSEGKNTINVLREKNVFGTFA